MDTTVLTQSRQRHAARHGGGVGDLVRLASPRSDTGGARSTAGRYPDNRLTAPDVAVATMGHRVRWGGAFGDSAPNMVASVEQHKIADERQAVALPKGT